MTTMMSFTSTTRPFLIFHHTLVLFIMLAMLLFNPFILYLLPRSVILSSHCVNLNAFLFTVQVNATMPFGCLALRDGRTYHSISDITDKYEIGQVLRA